MKLFLVEYTGLDQFNLDALVWADDRNDAVAIWRAYCLSEYSTVVVEPHEVFTVPTEAPTAPKVLAWHSDVVISPPSEN